MMLSWKRSFINLISLRNNKSLIHSFFSLKPNTLKKYSSSYFYRFTPVSFLLPVCFFLFTLNAKADFLRDSTTIDSLKTGRLWLAAHVLPGSGQIINKQYWKLPVFYGGMGGMLYLASDANNSYLKYKKDYKQSLTLGNVAISEFLKQKYTEKKQARNLCYAGAGAFYLASVVDALMVYNKDQHSPAAATIFSTLVPGLGQVYNQKYWKVPVVYGLLSTGYFLVDWNNRGYQRFKKALLYATDDDPATIDEFNGQRSSDELRLIKNSYRRYRDLCFLGTTFAYILNIIDANVDANLYDWDVSNDLSLKFEPSLNSINLASENSGQPAFGLSCKITF